MEQIHSEKLGKTFAPYAKGAKVGDTYFFSGQVALGDDGEIVPGGIAKQAEKIFSNINILLEESGLTVNNVAKLNIYITQMNPDNFTAFNEVYTNWVGEHRPARTAIGVFSLPKGGEVEVEFIAAH